MRQNCDLHPESSVTLASEMKSCSFIMVVKVGGGRGSGIVLRPCDSPGAVEWHRNADHSENTFGFLWPIWTVHISLFHLRLTQYSKREASKMLSSAWTEAAALEIRNTMPKISVPCRAACRVLIIIRKMISKQPDGAKGKRCVPTGKIRYLVVGGGSVNCTLI